MGEQQLYQHQQQQGKARTPTLHFLQDSDHHRVFYLKPYLYSRSESVCLSKVFHSFYREELTCFSTREEVSFYSWDDVNTLQSMKFKNKSP